MRVNEGFVGGCVGCIGTFDGVHRGHRALISRTVQAAGERNLPSALVTFDRHPAAVLAPDKVPTSLSTPEQNLAYFQELGLDHVLILPFTAELSQTPAEKFYQEILQDQLGAQKMVVGADFAFGRGREGTSEWLQQRIETEVVPPVLEGGEKISSSRIRGLIQQGNVEQAENMLARPYALVGEVVHGEKLGRQLGYPTANLQAEEGMTIPGDGVYAGWAVVGDKLFPMATSIGMRPAVQGTSRTVEAYLLDYSGPEFYGETVELHFVQRLRGEQDFPSLEALVEQIGRDVEECRSVLASHKGRMETVLKVR